MTCKKCGTEIGDAKFCPNCGQQAGQDAHLPEITKPVKVKRKKGCLKSVLIAFAVLVVLGAIGSQASKNANQGAEDKATVAAPADTASVDQKTEDTTTAKAEPVKKDTSKLSKKEKAISEGIGVDWGELCKQYDDNAIAADKTYKGKQLIVTGDIFDIGREVMQHPYVTFSKDGYLSTFQMVFNSDEESLVANLSKGQTIKVVGECMGESITTVLLDNCYLITE